MRVHRFCSADEVRKLVRGDVLVNMVNHSHVAGPWASSAKGFCFFTGNPDVEIHRLVGIVNTERLVTFEVDPKLLTKCIGRYAVQEDGVMYGVKFVEEYCCYSYSNKEFKIIQISNRYKEYPFIVVS